MHRIPTLNITDDLRITVGSSEIRLSPSQALQAAEELARRAFRRALAEEVEIPSPESKATLKHQ